ncbi:MAG: NAD(P)/FAD-dependent oxidoreductase [Flammeovirgaceae bacterium]
MNNTKNYEVVIIGGSYAGLSTAMALGRALRDVLIIDSGKPCNQQTPHSHNFLTQDGKTPAEISHIGRKQTLKYPTVAFWEDTVIQISGRNNDFTIQTAKRLTVQTKKVVFATGIKDLMPPIKGFADCWGITAIHCPYCHGYEVKAEKTGILVNNESAYKLVPLLLNWTAQLTIFTNGEPQFDIEKVPVQVIDKQIDELVHHQGYIKALQFTDGTTFPLTALYHHAAFEQHCKIPEDMGCQLTEEGYILVNDFQQTNMAGVYAVGDCTSFYRAVSLAVAAGTKAGAAVNHELIEEHYALVD